MRRWRASSEIVDKDRLQIFVAQHVDGRWGRVSNCRHSATTSHKPRRPSWPVRRLKRLVLSTSTASSAAIPYARHRKRDVEGIPDDVDRAGRALHVDGWRAAIAQSAACVFANTRPSTLSAIRRCASGRAAATASFVTFVGDVSVNGSYQWAAISQVENASSASDLRAAAFRTRSKDYAGRLRIQVLPERGYDASQTMAPMSLSCTR